MSVAAPVSYAALARHHAIAKPDAPAVTAAGKTLSWSELDRRTNRAARTLIAHGVKPDDFVSIALPNRLDFIEACFACWKAGATPQPVSPRLPDIELKAIIALAEPPLVIADRTIAIDRNVQTFDALLAGSDDDTALQERIAVSWKAPTSGGSTGRPKLIVAGQPAITQPDAAAGWRLGPDDVALMPGPLYHNGPFATAFAALTVGAHLVIMPRFDAEDVLRQTAAHKATWLYLVPTMMGRIWHLPAVVKAAYNVTSLTTVWHLAAPCPPWLKEAWIGWLGPEVIWELYAATEGLAGTAITGTDWLTHRGSVGRLIAGHIKIVDQQGDAVAPGTIGEVFMRASDGVPPPYRYIGAEARVSGDWQSLGDMGWMDGEGYLYLADRLTDMILVGGANVYPAEIEAALEEHPLVQSSAVIGLPDEDLGAHVHAIVQPRHGLTVTDLQEFLAQRLVSYKRPRSVEFTDTPLRDDAGKVRRSQLRDERVNNGKR